MNDAKGPVEPPAEARVGSEGAVGTGVTRLIQQVEERGASQPTNRAPSEEAGPQTAHPVRAGHGAAGQNSQALVRSTAQGDARAVAKTPTQSGPKTEPRKAAVAMAQSVAPRTT